MQVTKAVEELLRKHSINPDSSIDFDVNGELKVMTFEQITQSYMQASTESQLLFYAALEKSLLSGTSGVETFFEGMGKLLLMAQLSDNFEV